MGSPCGSTLADCPSEFKPEFYRRYIDDTFLLFKNQENNDKFKTQKHKIYKRSKVKQTIVIL